jgi:hypothetical protein
MLIGVGIGSLVLLALVWLLASRRKDPQQSRATAQAEPGYHSVVIDCGEEGCAAALAREGTVYLSSEAPLIPLPECDQSRCCCRYRHRQDRRQDARREEIDPQFGEVILAGQEDRRLRRDRRQR